MLAVLEDVHFKRDVVPVERRCKGKAVSNRADRVFPGVEQEAGRRIGTDMLNRLGAFRRTEGGIQRAVAEH